MHTYGSTGSYTVSLTVTGPGGNATKTKTDLIRVSASDSGDDTGPGPGDDSIADAEFVTNPIGGGAELPIEAGEITLDHEWKRVNFARAFIDPVVVSTSVSGNDDDPVTVRIAAVDQSGFFIRLQEWEYLDDQHVAETVGYLVVERGSHQLPNGAWLEADDIPVGSGDSWQVGSFIAPFATSPIVLSSVATYNDASAVVTRLRNISSTGFAMMMQGSEANGIAHATEMVSYVAWEASCGEINGYQFTVGKTADAVTHSPAYLGFTDQCDNAMTFTAPPVLLTDMQTTDGGDTANLRWDSKGNLSARVWVDEEQSRDGEVGHTTEALGYFVIGEASDTDGAAPSAPLRIEVGEAEVGHAWYRVDLEQQFSDPIVIAKLMSASDADPATIRIKDVDPTGFTLRVQEWDYLDDRHALERVSYMVVERGRHQLPNGDWIVAEQLTSATMGFTQSSFGHAFQATPVVIASVASEKDPEAVTTRIRNITTAAFEIRLQEQELSDQNHAPETIHYIALEPATFVIDGISVEVDRTEDAITHAQTEIDFAVQGAQLPLLLGDMQSSDGGDTSTLRVDQVDQGIATLWVEEEQSRDTEIGHTTETAGYVVID